MTTSMEEVVMAIPQVELGARPVRVIGAGKGRLSSTGEPMIFVALGERIDHVEYLALSVADAARLSGQLGDALRAAQPSIDPTTKGVRDPRS